MTSCGLQHKALLGSAVSPHTLGTWWPVWLGMFILAANLTQQEYCSIFGDAQEDVTMPKGEGKDLITFRTFDYFRPHDELMMPLWRATSLSLELLGSLSKWLQWGATFLYPFPIS